MINSVLLKNRPKDSSKEDFIRMWDNAGYTLQALNKSISDTKKSFDRVKSDDFDCPNHYAKLAYQAGYVEALTYVLSLLPESSNV